MNSSNHYTDERNRDLLREMRRQAMLGNPAGGPAFIDEIVDRAVHSPAPSYYLTFAYAYKMVSLYLRQPEQLAEKRSLRREAIKELAEKASAVINRSPHLSLSQALARVMTSEQASRYFINERTARKLYYEISRAAHSRRKRKLL